MSAGARTSVQPAFGLRLPDRYRVKRHVATGGMASVWCAEDCVLGRSVAIKILSDRFADDEFAVRRFMREARAAARVSNHPHVVTIYDVGEFEADEDEPSPRAFIVMEFLAGGTVADALRCREVGRDEALRWVAEAASALDHAHHRGIVHRDIKPANFLLDRSCGLHVADFGIAHLQSEDTITSSGQLFGTAAYLAPEQALGKDATGASDRYALAVATFELLTGSRPFAATHFAAQARQHIEDEPPRASERDATLPPAVDEILVRGMAKDPAERYASAAAFSEELVAVLATPTTAKTKPIAEPDTEPITRRLSPKMPDDRWAAGAAGAAGAAAGAAAAAGAKLGASDAAAAPAPRPNFVGSGSPAGARQGRSSGRPGPAGGGNGQRSGTAGGLPGSRPHRGRTLALVALGVVALGVIALLTQTQGSSPTASKGHGALARTSAKKTSAHHRRRPAHRTASASASSSSTTSTAAVASTPASTPATTPNSSSTSSAQALQMQGHQEILAGNYQSAISTLHEAVSAASPTSLTYAYALYDLGDALLLSGNPRAAIPVLEQRLKIPNQTATVQALLDRARRAAGEAPSQPKSGGG